MKLLEVTQKETLSREEAAKRLHAIADSLAGHDNVDVQRDGLRLEFHVPDEVAYKVELEVEDDGTELEIELNW